MFLFQWIHPALTILNSTGSTEQRRNGGRVTPKVIEPVYHSFWSVLVKLLVTQAFNSVFLRHSSGKRLFRIWLCMPLREISDINARYFTFLLEVWILYP